MSLVACLAAALAFEGPVRATTDGAQARTDADIVPAASGAGLVHVELKADSPKVQLERITRAGATTPVCSAPCSLSLPRTVTYQIGGDGVPSSPPFSLPDDRGEVSLNVRAGSSSGRALGGALIGIGGLAFFFGYLSSLSYPDGPDDSGKSTSHTANYVITIGGLVAAICGIALVATSHTKVVSSSGATF
jgi:hypothetical protein